MALSFCHNQRRHKKLLHPTITNPCCPLSQPNQLGPPLVPAHLCACYFVEPRAPLHTVSLNCIHVFLPLLPLLWRVPLNGPPKKNGLTPTLHLCCAPCRASTRVLTMPIGSTAVLEVLAVVVRLSGRGGGTSFTSLQVVPRVGII